MQALRDAISEARLAAYASAFRARYEAGCKRKET